MFTINTVLMVPNLTALAYLVAGPIIRYATLLFGLVITLHGTTKNTERTKAYTAFTHAMITRWSRW